jgi:hypothetical protein
MSIPLSPYKAAIKLPSSPRHKLTDGDFPEMTTAAIRISFDASGAHYQAGERLTGRYVVEGPQSRPAKAVEVSVLWYTAGKGEEDMAVHHFERHVEEPTKPLDLRIPRRFATVLPASPLSYDGIIVKICWCVRVRVFMPQGQEIMAEATFRLGDVPPAVLAADGPKEAVESPRPT